MSIFLKRGTEANRAGLSLRLGETIYTTDTRRVYIGSGSASTGNEIEFGQLSASFVSASSISASGIKVDILDAATIVGNVESSSYVEYGNVANKPALVSSSLQFGPTNNVTFGQITASSIEVQTLHVQTITSSVEYVSGSTIHGSLSGNTHQFTGSVLVNGSVTTAAGMVIHTTSNTSQNGGLIIGSSAKDTPAAGGVGSITIASDNATGSLQGMMSLVSSATATDRRLAIQCVEQGVSFRSITLAENGGNVGIGTTSPRAKLDVLGLATIGDTDNTPSQNAGLSIVRAGGNATSLNLWQVGQASGHIGFRANDRNLYVLNSYTDGTIENGKGIAIDTAGNVGIGTSSPTSKLEVAGVGRDSGLYITGATSPGLTLKASTGHDWELFSCGTGNAVAAGGFALYDNTAGAYRMVVDTAGNVGIGTTSPSAKLEIQAATNGGRISVTGEGGAVYNTINNYAPTSYDLTGMIIRASAFTFTDGATITEIQGNLIRCARIQAGSTASLNLGGAYGAHQIISPTGAIRFTTYGAGTLITDSSGNITATSDARMKDISGSFGRGLDAIMQLSPKVYHWKSESGLNTEDVNVGLIAQEVLPYIPEAIGYKDDKYTMSDRPIISALINAVKELKADNDSLRARIEVLEA